MLDIGILIFSLGIILLSAELFTNGVEWLGKRWGLSEGAVGSILAAVGTALPETLVPVIAIVFGGGAEAATEIGIGAILGAPFMLGTLALFVSGVAGLAFSRKRGGVTMFVDRRLMTRDLTFFILVYSVAIFAAFLPNPDLKHAVAGFLILAYLVYAYFTIVSGEQHEGEDLSPLLLARRSPYPPTSTILLQVFLALLGIIIGAHFFVGSVEVLATQWGISPLVLSLIITPIATELPEKFNSIIWIGKGKDTLALGNITGAMVFQSSVIPTLGIVLTPWSFTWPNLPIISAICALLSASVILAILRIKCVLKAYHLLIGGLFYVLFLTITFSQFM